jgi:hypothetical protein
LDGIQQRHLAGPGDLRRRLRQLEQAARGCDAGHRRRPGSPLWNGLAGADGTNVFVNSNFQGNASAIYFTTQNLGFVNRTVFGGNGNQISPQSNGSGNGCTAADSSGSTGTIMSPFGAPMVLNRADPTKIAIAPGYNEFNSVNGNFVYVAQDTTPASATSVDLVTTKVGTISTVNNGSEVTKLAYGIPANNNTGASANPDALLAGVQISQT